MATIDIKKATAPRKFQGSIVLTLTPEEAHALFLLTRAVSGSSRGTARQYTAQVGEALAEVGFDIDREREFIEDSITATEVASDYLGTLSEV